ncbi:hypothetical protein LSAT2_023465, partial [Lamellibrachia satsuma]
SALGFVVHKKAAAAREKLTTVLDELVRCDYFRNGRVPPSGSKTAAERGTEHDTESRRDRSKPDIIDVRTSLFRAQSARRGAARHARERGLHAVTCVPCTATKPVRREPRTEAISTIYGSVIAGLQRVVTAGGGNLASGCLLRIVALVVRLVLRQYLWTVTWL